MATGLFKVSSALLAIQAANQDKPALSPHHVRELTTLVFYLIFVLIAFVFGIFAIRRWAQRFRESTAPPKVEPTSTADVWSMHQVPAVADDSAPDDGQEPDLDDEDR